MRFKSIVDKLAVTLIGVICFLLILEFSLRIIGRISFGDTNNQFINGNHSGSHIILCLGDSWTFGIGAPYGKDYPRQLEIMLNSMSAGRRFKIINRGRGGHNTTQMLNELKNTLGENIKPELVIFLGGEANDWNYWGYHVYLEGNTFSSIINDHLYRIRIYKLARLLFKNIREKINNNIPVVAANDYSQKRSISKGETSYIDPYRLGLFCRSNQQYEEASKWLKKAIEINPGAGECYAGMGWVYLDQQQYDEAIKWFKKGIEINPGAGECYAGMGWVYLDQQQYDEAIKWFKKGIEINPGAVECYEGMGFAYKDQQQYDEAIKWFKKGIALNPAYGHIVAACYSIVKDQDKKKFLSGLSRDQRVPEGFIDMPKVSSNTSFDKEVDRWKIYDIKKIITICNENNIKIILMGYPKSCSMNDMLYNIAKANSVQFLDNHKIFSDLWKRGERREDYFAYDGHCNAKGYAKMAKNLFDRIMKDKILLPD